MKTKCIILVAGLVGVGKSTLAASLADDIGGIRIDVDVYKEKYSSAGVGEGIDPPEIRWKYYTEALALADELLTHPHCAYPYVVIDEVFHSRELRLSIEEFCLKNGFGFLWVEVKSSIETVKRRLCSKSRTAHIISNDEALRLHMMFGKVFDAFEPDDSVICIQNDDDVPLDTDPVVNWILDK